MREGETTEEQIQLQQSLDREFAVICLDWEGTGAAEWPQATELRGRLERLATLGADVALVTTADMRAVDARLRARPLVEGHLFVSAADGAEVYVIGRRGPKLVERRRPTPDEDAKLEAVAMELARRMGGGPGDGAVTPGRLGRRRVALAGEVPGGPSAAAELARELARDAGLPHLAIRVHGDQLTLGLTGKTDGVRDLLHRLVDERARKPGDLLLVGGGFAPPGGGEDSGLALIGELRRAAVVSVAEAAPTSPRTLHLGGGTAEVLRLLDEQLERREAVARSGFPEATADPGWRFEVKGFDPYREREVETWLTVANGESGTRGALEEGSAVSTPATFVAGVFGDGTGEPSIRQPVPAPDWTGLRLKIGDTVVNLANGEVLDHRRVLDMRHGVVYRYWRQRDGAGRTVTVRTARFASLADRHVLAMRAQAVPEDFAGRLVWEGTVGVSHAGGPTRETVFEALSTEAHGFVASTQGRNGGGHVLAVASRPAPGSPVAHHERQARGVIGGLLEPGEPAGIDRLAVIASNPRRVPATATARRLLGRAQQRGFDVLLRRHQAAWEERWRDADLVVDGDKADQEALRFSIFHMISTAHPTKDTVSVGARGLGGMSYFLHVFWDCEIFVLPFFIYTDPQTARTLLAYRYRNLAGARQKARQMGHRGALFPWESADKGVETTPPFAYGPGGEVVPILSGIMEHHISGDVAWGVWEYWKATADDAFMAAMGVELLLETARFWASRSAGDAEGRYHINVVVGPDEYHEGVDDNAYTNVLARWNIRRGLDALDWLERVDSGYAVELRRKLGLTPGELDDWRHVADGLVDGFDPDSLLYEQFAGFFDLDDVPTEKLRPRPMAADLLLGRDVTLTSKVVKQADVVMLCYILSDEISDEVARANYDYYEPITTHGSSLSPGIHAAVAAQLGNMDDAVKDFKLATAVDLADNMGNAARGLHMATMGGVWQAAVMGFAGVRRLNETLAVDPHLPASWKGVSFPLLFRGARLTFEVCRRRGGDELGITIERAPVRVALGGHERELHPGRYRWRRTGGKGWQEVEG